MFDIIAVDFKKLFGVSLLTFLSYTFLLLEDLFSQCSEKI